MSVSKCSALAGPKNPSQEDGKCTQFLAHFLNPKMCTFSGPADVGKTTGPKNEPILGRGKWARIWAHFPRSWTRPQETRDQRARRIPARRPGFRGCDFGDGLAHFLIQEPRHFRFPRSRLRPLAMGPFPWPLQDRLCGPHHPASWVPWRRFRGFISALPDSSLPLSARPFY